MIVRPREYLNNGMPTEQMLKSVLFEHLNGLPRLEQLKAYYLADNAIKHRQRAPGLPNNRVAHAFARYIAMITSGYLVGQPVSYAVDEDNATLNAILDSFARNAVSAADSELARDASIYGKGVEYVYVDADLRPRVAPLSPESAFVVYDDTYETLPLFGVYFTPRRHEDGTDDGVRIWVMSAAEIAEYQASSLDSIAFTEIRRTQHYFGDVPMVEYWNDDDERGDFEWVIPLIDAYDKLQSDRINDKEQFVDKLLLLFGCTMDTDERGRPPWQQLREDKSLSLPDTDSRAEYLGSAMDESGNQILRAGLVEDIHKLSMVPDMSDKNFANNVSGVAMRYKLMGLEQLTVIKQRWFTEGLKQRLKLFIHHFTMRGSEALDVTNIKIKFSRAMPANLLEIAQTVQTADSAGAMSVEEKVRALHTADEWTKEDIAREVQRIHDDKAEQDPMGLFGNRILPGNTDDQIDEQLALDQQRGA